jgi:hypothetical protein
LLELGEKRERLSDRCLRVKTDAEILLGGQLPEHRAPLFDVGQPQSGPLIRSSALDALAVEKDLAGSHGNGP